MYFLIKSSITYQIFYNLIILPFKTSFTKQVFLNLREVFRASVTYSLLYKYIDKGPYFLHSISYKIFREIVNLLDKIMDTINRFITRMIKNSKIYTEFKKFNTKQSADKRAILAICTASIVLGGVLAIIIFNKTNLLIKIFLLFAMCVTYLLNCDPVYFKESVFCRFFKYLFS